MCSQRIAGHLGGLSAEIPVTKWQDLCPISMRLTQLLYLEYAISSQRTSPAQLPGYAAAEWASGIKDIVPITATWNVLRFQHISGSLDCGRTRGLSQKQVLKELDIKSEHTMMNWKQFCRDVCVEHFLNNPQQIGGPGQMVEIDESLFFRRMYNRSRILPENWIFEGFGRVNKKGLLVQVPQRDAVTLLPIIQMMWQRAKNEFKLQHGSTNQELIPDYLAEFIWLQRFKDSPFLHLFATNSGIKLQQNWIAAKPWDRFNIDRVPTLNLGHNKQGKALANMEAVADRAERTCCRRKRMEQDIKDEERPKLAKLNEPGESIAEIFDEVDFEDDHEVSLNDLDNLKQHQDKSTQTEEFDYAFKEREKCVNDVFSEEYFCEDDGKVRFYTGLPSFDVFKATYEFVSPCVTRNSPSTTKFQEFILVLIKLRLNVPHQDLAYRFDISVTTVSRIFSHWLLVMDVCLSPLISWPEKAAYGKQCLSALSTHLEQSKFRLNEEKSVPLLDRIIRVCSALVNLCPGIIPFD
eukprot:gene17032-8540_t